MNKNCIPPPSRSAAATDGAAATEGHGRPQDRCAKKQVTSAMACQMLIHEHTHCEVSIVACIDSMRNTGKFPSVLV